MSGRSRRWVALPASLLVLVSAQVLALEDLRPATEVEAAFLYRFLFFLDDMPTEAPDGVLCLGVLGPNPFGELLDEIENRQVRGKTVRIRRFARLVEVDDCELVFLSPLLDDGPEWAARQLAGRPILTVSSSAGFAARDGMIELRVELGRVRFDVNRQAARRSGVRLGAELLEVARRIYP